MEEYILACRNCASKKQNPKIKWSSTESLLEVLKEDAYESLGNRLGVTGNSIRKKLKLSGVKPPRSKDLESIEIALKITNFCSKKLCKKDINEYQKLLTMLKYKI